LHCALNRRGIKNSNLAIADFSALEFKMVKQIAMRHFSGGNGTFAAGIEVLKAGCEQARRAIEGALADWQGEIQLENISHDPTHRANQDWDAELRLGLALHLQAAHAWVAGEGVSCRITPGAMEYTTGSGLIFWWSRWDHDPGYSFFVKHPTGRFPNGSSLRLTLEAAGWHVNSYDAGGKFIRTEEPLSIVDGVSVEVSTDVAWEETAGDATVKSGEGNLTWLGLKEEVAIRHDGEWAGQTSAVNLDKLPSFVTTLRSQKERLEKDEAIAARFLEKDSARVTLRQKGHLLLNVGGRLVVAYEKPGNQGIRLVGLEPKGSLVGRHMDVDHLGAAIDRLTLAKKVAEGQAVSELFRLLRLTGIPADWDFTVGGQTFRPLAGGRGFLRIAGGHEEYLYARGVVKPPTDDPYDYPAYFAAGGGSRMGRKRGDGDWPEKVVEGPCTGVFQVALDLDQCKDPGVLAAIEKAKGGLLLETVKGVIDALAQTAMRSPLRHLVFAGHVFSLSTTISLDSPFEVIRWYVVKLPDNQEDFEVFKWKKE
jgi:hypothetical protein